MSRGDGLRCGEIVLVKSGTGKVDSFEMLVLAAAWGIAGVLAILGYAVVRIFPVASTAFQDFQWGGFEWTVAVVWFVFMVYAEGVKGFHRAFSPRVVSRARALISQPNVLACVFAPLYCFGFFYATKKRKIVSWSVATGIVVLILCVRLFPQPWRGIIDAGVVAGLGIGMVSILYFTLRWILGCPVSYPADLPSSDPK